jgi:transglutaminase-like putative cysteine protease
VATISPPRYQAHKRWRLRVRRTAVLGTLAAVVLVWSWLRIEHVGTEFRDVLVWALLVGVVPALLPRRRLRLAAAALAAPVAVWQALDTVRPSAAWQRFSEGFLTYYDVGLPFHPQGQPLMHGLLLLAVFGFTLAVSLAVAEQRAVLAAGLLVAGAAWPATLLPGPNAVTRGVVILASALAILAGLSSTVRLRHAVVAAALVIAGAAAIAGVPAVAKGAFLSWETWDPYTKPDKPVSVRYVWDTTYLSLNWPKQRTTVFTVEALPVSRYWRATTLDVFNGDVWLDFTHTIQDDPVNDPLTPDRAQKRANQFEARVTVKALEDDHLIGASVPISFDADVGPVWYQETGTAQARRGIPRNTTYTAWSFTARPTLRALVRSPALYGPLLEPYLVPQTRYDSPPLPHFGQPGREAEMEAIFAQNPRLVEYRPLYDAARRVVGTTTSPYAAAVALENWFRTTGSFTYDQTPPVPRGAPLVDFITRTKRGYCQHFAGAMALMLRYLGIPARIGAGFTSGKYDGARRRWIVTDHDAHTWVEVWFRGYGWLAFDPTPGRGTLDGSYSSASVNFNATLVAAAIAEIADPGAINLEQGTPSQSDQAGRDRGGRDVPGDVAAPSRDAGGSLLRLLVLAALGLAAAIALVKTGVRRARFLTRNPRRVAAACRSELADFLADQGVTVPESATIAELGELLRRETGLDPSRFVDAVDTARFGPPARAADASRLARRELRELVRALRQRLSAWERFRGLVSLRSLGLT